MMAIDNKRLNRASEVLGEASVDKALKARAETAMQARFLAIAAGADGWEAGCLPARRWFVIKTASRLETSVEKCLADAGIQCWFPLKTTEILVQGTRRIRNVRRPIWLGYLFVSVVPTDETWAGLYRVDGVQAVLGTASGPAALTDEIMNDLMGLVKKGAFDEKHNAKPFAVGSMVMVKAGPFEGFQGVIEGYVGTRAARVLTSIFGGVRPIEIDVAQLTN